VWMIGEPAKASPLRQLLERDAGNGRRSEHVLAEVRGISDRVAEGVSQGGTRPVRVEDVNRRDCLAEHAPTWHDYAQVAHWGPVVQAVAAQGALDGLAARNGGRELLDGRRCPRLSDHPD